MFIAHKTMNSIFKMTNNTVHIYSYTVKAATITIKIINNNLSLVKSRPKCLFM